MVGEYRELHFERLKHDGGEGGRNDSIYSGLSTVKNDYWVLITFQKVVHIVETQSTLNKMNKVPVLVEFVIKSGMQAYKKVLLL